MASLNEKLFSISKKAKDGDICEIGSFNFLIIKKATYTEWVFDGHSYYDVQDLAKAVSTVLILEEI